MAVEKAARCLCALLNAQWLLNTIIFTTPGRGSCAEGAKQPVAVFLLLWILSRPSGHGCPKAGISWACVGLGSTKLKPSLTLLSDARPLNFHASVSPLLDVSAGADDPLLSKDQIWGCWLRRFGSCRPGASSPDLLQSLKFICSSKSAPLQQKFLSGWQSADDSWWNMCAVAPGKAFYTRC